MDYIKIGEKIKELRDKMIMLKSNNADYADLRKCAMAIIIAFEYYDKAKFGHKKHNISIEALMR